MKKLLSIVLTVMIFVSCISTSVFAAKTYDEIINGINPLASIFADVTNDFWAAQYIKKLKEMNILSGKGNGMFDPEGNVTRAEMAKIISLVFNLDDESESLFSDVDLSQWYAPYVNAAAKAGIVNGYEDGTFKPEDFVTREEIAAMIVRAKGADNFDIKDEINVKIKDISKASEWAYPSLIVLISAGILGGDENANINPSNNASRAEVAKIICGIL
ncbi:MAG: S-layer homology domain-containing protein [Clostridia bacterium]|nr:S-layer homology domain-containing protein [Clostridia bacterium]